jgi:hypothetical protein
MDVTSEDNKVRCFVRVLINGGCRLLPLQQLPPTPPPTRNNLKICQCDARSKGVLDYFGVTADEAPTIYLVVLKDQMLK